VQVVDLRLLLGEILLMAQQAICACLFRSFSLRDAFFGGIGGAPEAPLMLSHKIETRVVLEVGR
jgi:hypothetical protein